MKDTLVPFYCKYAVPKLKTNLLTYQSFRTLNAHSMIYYGHNYILVPLYCQLLLQLNALSSSGWSQQQINIATFAFVVPANVYKHIRQTPTTILSLQGYYCCPPMATTDCLSVMWFLLLTISWSLLCPVINILYNNTHMMWSTTMYHNDDELWVGKTITNLRGVVTRSLNLIPHLLPPPSIDRQESFYRPRIAFEDFYNPPADINLIHQEL